MNETVNQCRRCGQPTAQPDDLICPACHRAMSDALLLIAQRVPVLMDVAERRVTLAPRDEAAHAPRWQAAAPIREGAFDLLGEIRQAVADAAPVCDCAGIFADPLPQRLLALREFDIFLARADSEGDGWAPDWVDRWVALAQRVRAATERPEPRAAVAMAQVVGLRLPPTAMATVLAAVGLMCKPVRIRQWIHKGLLAKADDGTVLAADVIRLIRNGGRRDTPDTPGN